MLNPCRVRGQIARASSVNAAATRVAGEAAARTRAGDSLRLLASIAGAWPVEDDPAAAAIVDRCGHLPVAIRIVAAQCRTGGLALAHMASTLSFDSQRLDQLSGDGRSVRASLLSAYASLGDRERKLLRGLAVTTSQSFPDWVADAIVDSGAGGRLILQRLIQASFVEPRRT